jgi:hypothetical protein
MFSTDDFRFDAHHRLLKLDAATNHLMLLVVSNEVSGREWEDAVAQQKQAYEAWSSILCGVRTDPMSVLDGRPANGSKPAAE